MARHNVELEIGTPLDVGRVDFEIHIRSDDKYRGSVHVSKGTIDWVKGRRTRRGRYTATWEEFIEWMESGTPKEIGTTGRRAPRKKTR